MNLILSPHLDDAVLSLGQYMTAIPGACVATVFAGVPDEGLSDYDRSCGFESSRSAVFLRRAEDKLACAAVGARPYYLDFLDRQYGAEIDDDTLTAAIAKLLRPDTLTFVPLGIGHPDHVQVARCARAACTGGTLVCYEELPYRVLWPEQAAEALAKIRSEGFAIGELPYPLEQGDRARKCAAVAEYASQFPDGASDPCLLVPERCWRIAR